MPRLSTSPCVKPFRPSAVRTTIDEPVTRATVPFLTSVTVTGVSVVLVVIVAVPVMPGFSSSTDIGCPFTVSLKSGGTVSSLVPSGSLTTRSLPLTAMISNVFVSVVLVVCAGACAVTRPSSAQAANPTRNVERIGLLQLGLESCRMDPHICQIGEDASYAFSTAQRERRAQGPAPADERRAQARPQG